MADNTNHYSRYSPQDRSLRASDHDRDAIGDILRRQHVAGRLDADEFAERYGRCLEAKTYAQLDGLVADLPFDGRAPHQPGPAAWADGAWATRRWRAGRRLWRVPCSRGWSCSWRLPSAATCGYGWRSRCFSSSCCDR